MKNFSACKELAQRQNLKMLSSVNFGGTCIANIKYPQRLQNTFLTISLISSIHGETQSERSGFPRHSPFKPHCHLAEPETTMYTIY